MCGIIGYAGHENAAPVILDGLKRLEYRGYDSAGLAVLNGGKLRVVKSAGYVEKLAGLTGGGAEPQGFAGIGHTRWATHGSPTDVNAHPLVSCGGKIALVHNGIIENYARLRETLRANGFTFNSETDTEVAANLIQYHYDRTGEMTRAVRAAALEMEGSYALGILCEDMPGAIFAVKKESPLILGMGDGCNYIASDVAAILSRTRKIIKLQDGEIAVITADSINICTGGLEPVSRGPETVDWDIGVAEKGGREHFMLKEIYEQPDSVHRALSPRLKDGGIDLSELGISDGYIKNISRIYIAACGTAAYAGVVMKYTVERLARIPAEVIYASEFRYNDPILNENTLVVCISQSGTTADTIAALREAKRRGAKVLSIVNVVGSVIAEESDWTMYMYAGPEIAVASTKVYSAMLASAYLLALRFARVRTTVSDVEYTDLAAALHKLPGEIERALKLDAQMRELAEKYYECDDIYFIGRGHDYALSLEGELKLKEISYIHSEAYPAGELKHGPIALIDDKTQTPVVAVATSGRLIDKTLSNAIEVKARGARVIALTTEATRAAFEQAGAADDIITIADFPEILLPSIAIIPLQLFAYYVALKRGCPIDKPRNLAKSVTVE